MLDGEEWEMKFLVLFADFMSFFYMNIYFFLCPRVLAEHLFE